MMQICNSNIIGGVGFCNWSLPRRLASTCQCQDDDHLYHDHDYDDHPDHDNDDDDHLDDDDDDGDDDD